MLVPYKYSGPRPIDGPEDHSFQRSRKTIYNFFDIFQDQLGPTLSVCVQLVKTIKKIKLEWS
jgi:hypothetical protein